MTDKKFDERTPVKRAKDWLVTVVKETPDLRVNQNDIFSGNRKSMFLFGEVRKATLQTDIDFDQVKLKELKKIVNSEPLVNIPDTAIAIRTKNIGVAAEFFTDNGIVNEKTKIAGDNFIVIDLAQEYITDKLRHIFYEKCVPEKKLQKSKDFLDPDGNCFDHDAAKEEVAEKLQALVNYADKHGIGKSELAEILRRKLPKSADKGRGE